MVHALKVTGAYLRQHANKKPSSDSELQSLNARFFDKFEYVIRNEFTYNPWFTEDNIRKAIVAIADSLNDNSIAKWMGNYPKLPVEDNSSKTIGVVMAGNIPLVGFHDMISVIMSGHTFLGKTSSKDDRLIRSIADLISFIEPGIAVRIKFTENYLNEAEAIIATGSNNTSRYFEYYFRNIPHIIRKNRSGLAILTGKESNEDLLKLGEDIFSYFGLGCRNVTKIFIPEDYKLDNLLFALESFSNLSDHNKYMNNIDYMRSVYLMNQLPFLDNGVVLMKEEEALSSPVGVVYYEKYSQIESVFEKLSLQGDMIQCVVSTTDGIDGSVLPGNSQSPALWDYADGMDTMKFLEDLIQ
jgi:hypothetical protein